MKVSKKKVSDGMFDTVMEEMIHIMNRFGLDDLQVLVHPMWLFCLFLSILFVHYVLKGSIAFFCQVHYTLFLMYICNSFIVLAITICLMIAFDAFIVLKIGLVLLFGYGVCLTFLSLLYLGKVDKNSA